MSAVDSYFLGNDVMVDVRRLKVRCRREKHNLICIDCPLGNAGRAGECAKINGSNFRLSFMKNTRC